MQDLEHSFTFYNTDVRTVFPSKEWFSEEDSWANVDFKRNTVRDLK